MTKFENKTGQQLNHPSFFIIIYYNFASKTSFEITASTSKLFDKKEVVKILTFGTNSDDDDSF